MNILFVHQNFPGQFLHLAPELRRRGHACFALTTQGNDRQSATHTWRYKFDPPEVDRHATRLGRSYTAMSDRGVVVARAALTLRDKEGFYPDLIIGHSGWGETLFLKQVWPKAKMLVYAEFYYQGIGADVGFDPEFGSSGFAEQLSAQARSAHMAQSLLLAECGLSPTNWQASSYPTPLRKMIEVVFDGVDTARMHPEPDASFTLPSGKILRAGDEVLTFVNRNLEPYRGFHVFMRALPEVLAARPEAEVVILGGDAISYGVPPASGVTWKAHMLAELGDRLDLSRVHFLGKVPYPSFRSLMQVSRVHAYLTYPFVLSWSMVEAMAAGALVVGSDTAPVAEMITHGETGLLVDFFDIKAWSAQLTEALAKPEDFAHLRRAARQHVVMNYDLQTICLPAQVALIERLLAE